MKYTKSNTVSLASLVVGSLWGCAGQSAAVENDTRAKGGKVAVSEAHADPQEGSKASDAVVKIHPGDSWYKFRGDWLGLSVGQMHDREAAITSEEFPRGFWDEQVAVEAVGLWAGLCNDCHGGRRRVADAKMIPAPPEGWGKGPGVFFGRTRERADIFRTIHGGGAPSKDVKTPTMPAWGDKLSREQIWAMIYFVEYFSGGIEGHFPPGLYPKRQH